MGKHKTDAENTLPASYADRHKLYQWSVQVPEFEVEFMAEQFEKLRGRPASLMREDFCGTGILAANWVKLRDHHHAIGLDLDRETLDWGLEHNIKPLGELASRIDLREADVRTVTEPADIVCAYNFSWFLIYPTADLVEYFKIVRQSLKPDGLMFMDMYGGWEASQVVEEPRLIETDHGNFTYTWQQKKFDPINNVAKCHIHFELDGLRMKKAFTYKWRLYTPAECREALLAAGFKDVIVFWDHSDDPDNDDYRPTTKADNQPGWLAYIVGVA